MADRLIGEPPMTVHELRRWLVWQRRQLDALGVEVRRSTTATAADVAALDPHTAIVAAGASHVPTAVAADDGTVPVLTPDDVLDRPVEGRRVIVFDAVGELDGAAAAAGPHRRRRRPLRRCVRLAPHPARR